MFTEYLDTHDLRALLSGPGSYQPFPRRQNRAAWEGLVPAVKQELCAWGDEALAGYPPLTATQYLAFSRTGDRQVFEKPYFARRKLLIGATLAECVLNDGAHLDAIIDGLWAICEESSWVVSAHCDSRHLMSRPMQEHPLPEVTDPYIDLFSAQTAATLSFVLYFMEDRLDAVTPRIARRVRRELETRILHPFEIHDDFWWMGMIRRDMNNWTPWILSNVLYTVLLIERDGVRRCELTARAMRMLDSYLAVMPEDGGCDEGAGYFNVAGASLLDCLEAIHEATDGRVSFYDEPHIREIGAYPLKAHVSGPYYLNFADCDVKPMLDAMPIVRYGLRTQNPALTALGVSIRRMKGAHVRVEDTPQMNRVLYSIFDSVPEVDAPEEPPFMAMPDLQVYAWRFGGLYAAIKGGCNAESHNHNDVGTFVVYVDGEPAIVDMGNKVYTAKTFSPERYTIDNTRSRNHNVPLIGEIEQHEGREYAARGVSGSALGVSMDIAGAYPAQAKVKRLVRSLVPGSACVQLQDEIELEEAQSVTWVFMLRQRPELAPGAVRFGPLVLRHDQALSQKVQEMPVTDARLARNFPGSLWRLTLSTMPVTAIRKEFTIEQA